MKKRGILIFVVLLISMSAIFFANKMQKKLASNEVASKTESKVLQGNVKENTNEDVKKNDNGNIQNTDKASNNIEIKNQETKETSKTVQQDSSNKVNETNKQGTAKAAAPKSNNTNATTSTSGSANTNSTQNTNQDQSSNLPPNFIVRDTVNNKVILSKHIDLNGETVASITRKNIACKESMPGYFNIIAGLKAQDKNVGPYSGWCYYINGTKPSIGAGDYELKKDDVVEWKYLKDGVNN